MDMQQVVSGVVSGLVGGSAIWLVYLRKIDKIDAIETRQATLEQRVKGLEGGLEDAHNNAQAVGKKIEDLMSMVGKVAENLAYLMGRFGAHNDTEAPTIRQSSSPARKRKA